MNIVSAQTALSASAQGAAGTSTLVVLPDRIAASEASATGSAFLTDTPSPKAITYPRNGKQGERLGTLSIPATGQKLPIIQGTENPDLKQGVGHFMGSVLPGESDNCVLSAHRDSFFSRLGELNVGDRLITETAAGTFTYKVRRIRIVGADDRTVIVPADHAVLTLSTCYPFNYVGNAPKRYIVVADMVTGE